MIVGTWLRSALPTGQLSATITVGMCAAAALAASLMLALGNQTLLYRDPGQIVAVWESVESGRQNMAISGPDLTDFADATHSIFAAFGGFAVPRLWMFDRRGSTQIRACYIHASVFSDLGIRPVLGRGVRPDDEPLTSGATPPAWISYHIWQTRYDGSPSAIGATIGIADSATGLGEVHTRIVGVLPSGVSIPLPFMENTTDIWYILSPSTASRPRESTVFFGLGRLRPGASVAQAQAALTAVAGRLGQRYIFERRSHPVVQSLEEIAKRDKGGKHEE